GVRPVHAPKHVVIAISPECFVIGRRPEPERVIVVGIGPEEGPGPERAGKAPAARATKERRIETMAGGTRLSRTARDPCAARRAAEGAACEGSGAAVFLPAYVRAAQRAGGVASPRPRSGSGAVQPALARGPIGRAGGEPVASARRDVTRGPRPRMR